jgi:ATP-dependent RNA helicase RhlE
MQNKQSVQGLKPSSYRTPSSSPHVSMHSGGQGSHQDRRPPAPRGAYHGRPSTGGYRGGRRGGFSGGRGGGKQRQFMDISKFINKAVITENVPHFKPEHSFLDFKIEEKLKGNILKEGLRRSDADSGPGYSACLGGQDVVGIANTGTGKTAAFLIPLIDKVLKNRKEKILIMVPTRELATQIDDELRDFALMLSIFSVCCVGGAPIVRQMSNLRRVNNFVIGTPGRLKDLVERKALNLAEFKTVVLDEADRMLDMGFIHDMRFMISKMPVSHQTLFFSLQCRERWRF